VQRRLFLTGPSGAGKSRLIRSCLGGALAEAGGFITGPEAPGSLVFTLRPAAACAGVEGFEAGRFLDASVWPPVRDNEVFRALGARLLREAVCYPFAVADEIGGYELLIPQFRTALEALLQSELPLLGALRTREEALLLGSAFGLGERYAQYVDRLHEALRADPDTLIVALDGASDAAARSAVTDWAAAYAR